MPRHDEHEAVNNRLMTEQEIEEVFDMLGLLQQQQRAKYIALSEQKPKSADVIYTTRLSNNSEPIIVTR